MLVLSFDGDQPCLLSFPTRRSSDLRNFTRRQVAIQNRGASNIGISQSTFSDIAGDPVLRSEERFSRNAETELLCRLLLQQKKLMPHTRVRCAHRRCLTTLLHVLCRM